MTLDQARKILRLAPDEDPRAHFAEFQEAREHIASMIRTAPDPTLSGRYMRGLIEFDEALAVIKKHCEPAAGDSAGSTGPKAVVGKQSPPAPTSHRLRYVLWFATVFLVTTIGLWFWFNKTRQAQQEELRNRVATLERKGLEMIENRRWQDALSSFEEIEKLVPGSDISRQGQLRVEAGMTEEQTQFIGYWTGQATAELEAGRLDEAEAAARQVLEKYPIEKDAAQILSQIANAREAAARTSVLAAAREALAQRHWSDAISQARRLLEGGSDDPQATAILTEAQAAMEKAIADEARALELLKLAVARDEGKFDQQALDWLREAKSLAPDNAEIAAQLEKQASYTRTLRVPEDFATPAEALAGARDRDRIVLGAGDWKGPLIINAAVELQGTSAATTNIECPPGEGSALTIGPDAKDARITGITFRHESFAIGNDRFSVALVRGGRATFSDCRFTDASGHGLAVIEGGHATVSRSRFAGNGWDGIAAFGQGSTLEVRDSEVLENFQNGIESWDGAAVILLKNRCEGNSRNGIHADNQLASATIEGNQLLSNREFGLVLASAGSGKITGNTATENLMGGMVIRAAATQVTVSSNQISLNKGPGLVLEKGLDATTYSNNSSARNSGIQLLANADLSSPAETGRDDTEARPAATPTMPPPRAIPAPEPATEVVPRAVPVAE
jgi:parallel beta-helix repeat protein